jgi:hypothetical protein
MNSSNKIARAAGLLYLMVMASGVFANLYVRSTLILPGDATATATSILASEALFRLGFVGELVHMTSFFFLTLALYLLFRPVDKALASLLVLFALVAVPIEMLNSLNNLAALLLFEGADYLSAIPVDQLNAQAMFFLDLQDHGYFIAQVFTGLWMLPLGYLVLKSGFFPKILGILLIIGCFGQLVGSLQSFLLPSLEVITYPGLVASILAELSFTLWLLIKGASVQRP